MSNVEAILESIEKLTLIEASELVKAMEESCCCSRCCCR